MTTAGFPEKERETDVGVTPTTTQQKYPQAKERHDFMNLKDAVSFWYE